MKKFWTGLAMASALAASGCAGVDLVAAGRPFDLGDGVSVVPTTAWARVHAPASGSLLTIDGVGLGEVHYYTGVAPGKPVYSIAGVSDSELGVFKQDMLPNDTMELLVANLSKAGNQNVRTSNLRPTKFGTANGFRFDLSFVTKEGLNMKGEALLAQRGGKLDVLLFMAPDEYYFARRQPDVEQLFATIQVAG